MKGVGFLLPLIMIFTVLTLSCSKKNDNNNGTPAERKKYAWAAGDMDSTGYGGNGFPAY